MGDNTVSQNNKRIAKNTLLLSMRMFFTMAIGIYSSRVILHNLGVSDYGIYSVVGGVISMFTFINATMVNGTQRYLNFYLGKKDIANLNKVFSTSVNIFILLALLIGFIGEIVGIYFINCKLDIPEERIIAAHIVFQFTVISALVNIISSPYNALIISYEKMGTFAYVSIAQSITMLLIAFSIPYIPFDGLVVYALLVCLLQIGIRIFYGWYCSSKFNDVRYSRIHDKTFFKELFSFSGWTLLGSFAYMTYHQGIVFLMNMFFGPIVNAAQALAIQVNGSVSAFSANFMMAAKPQITKYYAEGKLKEMKKLVFFSSKLSYAIMTVVAIPIIVRIDYILKIWLHEVPNHTANFIVLYLLIAIISSLTPSVVTAVQSTGVIRKFQIYESIGLFLILPMSYLSLVNGGQPEIVYVVMFVLMLLTHIVRLVFMQKQLRFSMYEYVFDVILRMVSVVSLSWFICDKISMLISDSFFGFVIVSLVSVSISVLVFAFFGLRPSEVRQVYIITKDKIINRIHLSILR